MGKVRPSIHSRLKSIESLRAPLERIIEQYDPSFLPTDPLRYAHRYKDKKDQELVSFLAALLAFGGVKAIFGTLDRLLAVITPSPVQYLLQTDFTRPTPLHALYHRWVKGTDIVRLFSVLKLIYEEHGSLESFFNQGEGGTLKERMNSFSKRIKTQLFSTQPSTRGLQFLLPSPSQGSACKRINLFLRWVVRKEAPDLGIWKSVNTSELYLPIDIHLGKIVRYIGLTQKKVVNWKMVEEVSHRLRLLYPNDPIRLDFALARLGILNFCIHKADPLICLKCPLHQHCSLFKRYRKTHLDLVDATS